LCPEVGYACVFLRWLPGEGECCWCGGGVGCAVVARLWSRRGGGVDGRGCGGDGDGGVVVVSTEAMV